MRNFLLIITMVFLTGCKDDKRPITGVTDFQRKLNASFKDATTSPLKDKDRKEFFGLDYFPVDSSYVVMARLERTPETEYFEIRTTTDRISRERVYGVLHFNLEGNAYKLNVYQGEGNLSKKGFEDYLFLPFLDQTNGEGSYNGGRYIDLRTPQGDSITIDFNTAYNPYCAYNEKYSCPIVPRVNYLPLKVEAGVKAFKKH